VGVARYGDPQGLQQDFRTIRGNANLRFNATFGQWRVSLTGSHQESDNRTLTNRQDLRQGGRFILLGDDRNPFDGSLADLLPIVTDRSTSRNRSSNLQLTASGSPLRLPSGPVQATAEGRMLWSDLNSRFTFLGNVTDRSRSRSERALRGSLEIPLASRRYDFLPFAGELAATFEYGVVDFSRVGSLEHYGYGLTWSPRDWIRLRGAINHLRRPPNLQLLADPVIVTPGVRTFDFVRGETVDVIWISGGNPDLLPESVREEQLSLNIQPWQAINLLLNAEYRGMRNRNYVAPLPPASLAILQAFPDRYLRDETGRLTQVDIRPVNFDSLDEDRLRYGFSLSMPIGRAAAPLRRPSPEDSPEGEAEPATEEGGGEGSSASTPSFGGRGGNRMRLQVSANHSIVLVNDVSIRPGLPIVDLLEGGAIGIIGGRHRHQVDFAIGLNSRGLGARLTGIWRSSSLLETRLGGTADRLRFSSYGTLNLRTFADARRLFPGQRWLRGTRFSINVVNLTNERQRVVDSTGTTPLQYQLGYRDPLGRTIEFEIRRVF
jgi:iron complex outermembrane receptor protein